MALDRYPSGSAEAFLAEAAPATPYCLVLDVELPGMNGLALQQVLEHRRKPPPIVFISGCHDTGFEHRARSRGAVDFLKKPFDPQYLLGRIDHALQLSAAHGAATDLDNGSIT